MHVYGWDVDGTLLEPDAPWAPIQHAIDEVKRQLAQGAKLVLITARTTNFVDDTHRDMQQLGLRGAFDIIEHHPWEHPWDPVAYKADMMRRHGVTWYCGDSDTDRLAAEKAGAFFVHVRDVKGWNRSTTG